MEDPRSDADLVRACLAGELRAFEALVQRYQKAVYRGILGYVRDPEEAQDIAQETFWRVYQALGRLTAPEQFGAWLWSAAQRGCLNALRAKRRAGALHAELEKEEVGAFPPTPGPPDDSPVADLLSRLPADSAQVLVMHYLEDLPLAVVAQRLGCSPQSAKQRLYRIRQQVQKEVLNMMKDGYDKENLPEEFASRVMARLLETGRRDRLYMRYERARARFQEAVAAAPTHPGALLELGRSYDPLQWPSSQDVEVLERAAAAAPDSLDVWGELELAYRQPEYETRHGRVLQKCLALCDRRLADKPGDGQALKHKARLLDGSADWAGAETLLRAAVEGTPEDQEACFYLARALDRQGRHDEAHPLYDRVCALDSRTVWAYLARRQQATHLAFRKGETGRAVELMEGVWAMTQRPDEAGNLIYFYSATGQLQEAVAVFREVEEYQHHPRVWVTVGLGYRKSRDLQAAERVFQAAVAAARDPGLRAEAQLHLAAVLFSLEKTEEAHQALSEGLALDLEARGGLAQDRASAFWRPWTGWLAETLESLVPKDRRVERLLQAVQRELAQVAT